jgi:hypothetical protein
MVTAMAIAGTGGGRQPGSRERPAFALGATPRAKESRERGIQGKRVGTGGLGR